MTRFTEGYAASVAPLSRALRAFAEPDGGGEDRRWLWLACRLAQDLWDDELWHVLATRGVRVARDTGALNLLPNALNYLAALNVHSGAFATAAALIDEVDAITQATGLPPLKYAACMLAAARGDQAQMQALVDGALRGCARRAARARRSACTGGSPRCCTTATASTTRRSRPRGRRASTRTSWRYGWALVELVEAGVRGGQPDEAAAALERLSERTRASGTEWALGIEARCRALLSDDESALPRVDRAARAQPRGGRARAQPARVRRVAAAREPAHGRARAAARRARELQPAWAPRRSPSAPAASCSPPARPRAGSPPDTRDALTPQEVQVARLARDGHTNPEIGAQLFISPRTVEYHLHKVFRKLDVSSRKELRAALADTSAQAALGAV